MVILLSVLLMITGDVPGFEVSAVNVSGLLGIFTATFDVLVGVLIGDDLNVNVELVKLSDRVVEGKAKVVVFVEFVTLNWLDDTGAVVVADTFDKFD
ncbi:hypothetical protein DERF_002819 [Dermatophagoides farinae]|uniref:Uncharacterized protein n=1 Tax=Dermatophagoides farinae TaxID=6954 RepID=A0A922LC81_DERFA|nr:hypothetical protein DERF_002819 [Dermatophagoides farinae]